MNCARSVILIALLLGKTPPCSARSASVSKTAPAKVSTRIQPGRKKTVPTLPGINQLLADAVQKNDLRRVQALLAKGASPNARNNTGSPAVMVAANRGYLPIVQTLLGNRANPNLHSFNKKGGTALLEAVVYERVAIVKLLLLHGANVEEPYGNGIFKGATPLQMAATSSNENKVLLLLLLKAGARVDAADVQGNTALHQVAASGTVSAAQLLLEHGATVDARTWIGMTPLMNAALGGNVAMVKLLIAKGANVNARSDAVRRAYGRAGFMGDTDTMRKLEQSGRLSNLHEDDASVLEWTMGEHKAEIVALLQQAGAKSPIK